MALEVPAFGVRRRSLGILRQPDANPLVEAHGRKVAAVRAECGVNSEDADEALLEILRVPQPPQVFLGRTRKKVLAIAIEQDAHDGARACRELLRRRFRDLALIELP